MTQPTSPAATPAPTQRRGVLSWLSRHDDSQASAATAGRSDVARQLYDDIGDLIFANALTPSPQTFAVAHAYLSGEDAATAAAVAEQLRERGALTSAAVEKIAGDHAADALTPDVLARIAEALELRIADCVAAVGRSRGSAETFGSALDREASKLATDPAAALQHIIALTGEAVTATRLVEGELRRTQNEADQLRSELQNARRAAEHDHLTGLPNRRFFETRLKDLVADEQNADAAVALCDIDDFKQINDRYGHSAGDRVLRFVAHFLRTQLGRTVVVARYGGEEFACLFYGSTPDEAQALLDTVRDGLAQRSLVNRDTGEPMGRVTFSAGITRFDRTEPTAALHRADLALYAAKGDGKNRVMIVD